MHGDLSRTTFNPQKAYSSVRGQQGRATLDADVNEQVDIQLHDTRTGRRSLIGPSGGHLGEAGFEIQVVGNQLQIQPGTYWVDGIGVNLGGAALSIANQPNLPEFALPTAAGLYIAYLDVWERPITAIQDPDIREVALGGPDTSTRTQVVWQVRLLPVTTNDSTPDCSTPFPEWARLVAGAQGTLEVRVAPASQSADPCLIPESAGFRGLENQLYLIKIHDGNFSPIPANSTQPNAPVTFKWSRDNGSVVASWREHPAPLEITIDRLGPGGAAGFRPDNWIELTSDHDDLLERGGVVGRVDSVSADTLILDDPNNTLGPALTPTPKSNAARHTQARRWDSAGKRSTVATVGQPDVTNDGWIRIEDGIEVRFSGGPFASGSYWSFPARTATLPGTANKQVDWPTVNNQPLALRARGPAHHYARLAILQLTGTTWTRLTDCRQLFPALTELVQLQTIGGDGQHGRANHWLPSPVTVAVFRGGFPIAGARVRFAITPSSTATLRGVLNAAMPSENGQAAGSATTLDVVTDQQGRATVWWRLGAGQGVEELGDVFQRDDAQEVTATLLAVDDTPTTQTARFSARVLDNYVLVAAGGDGQMGQPGETLEIALRARVSDGGRPVPGARVEFRVMDTVLNGQALDQFTGGSLNPSVNLVSSTTWPNGNRILTAVVETDSTGVAQVQWILGTEAALGVQRVEARLLDEASQVTTQSTLFTAHLGIAAEIGWVVAPILTPHLPSPTNTVQSALEGIGVALERLGLPLYAIRPRLLSVANARVALDPNQSIALANWAAIELQAIFPVGFDTTTAELNAAISVWFERLVLFQGSVVGATPIRLSGNVVRQGTTLAWQLTPLVRTFLQSELAQGPRRVSVEIIPSALKMHGSVQSWAFTLTPG